MSFTGFVQRGEANPADWDEVPALSYSVAKVLVTKSPAAAYAYHRLLGNEKKDASDAQIRGIIFDELLLGDGTGLSDRIVVVNHDSFRTDIAKSKRDAALAEGKIPVIKAKFDECRELVDEHIRPRLGDIFGVTKLRMAWMSDGDVLCHGEMDSLNENGVKGEGLRIEGLDEGAPVVFDVKSCTDAIEAAEDRKIYDFDYQIQRASYLDALSVLRPDLTERVQFVFVFCEVCPPYDVRFVMLERSFVEMGQGQWGRAVYTWRECMKTNRWPGSGRKIYRVGAPIWAMRKEATIATEIAEGRR